MNENSPKPENLPTGENKKPRLYSNRFCPYAKRVKVKKGLNNYILNRFGQYPKGFYTAKFTENISIESLLIHDQKDKVIPFSDLSPIERGLKNSKSYVTTGLGHKLKHEKVWKICLEFLEN